MNRTFKYFTLAVTGTPQPAFGTTLSAAFVPTTDGLGNPTLGQVVAVTDADLPWERNDQVIVVEADGSLLEGASIIDIDTVGGTLTLSSLRFAHAAGARVILNNNCTAVYVQGVDGAAGDIGIGTSRALNATTGRKMIALLKKVPATTQPPDFSSANVMGLNPASTSEYWIVGTNPDKYLPSCIVT